MPIAYSENYPTFWYGIDGSSAATLIAGIHKALLFTGWAYTAISGGWRYDIQSPQGLTCRVLITDAGTPPGGKGRIHVQFQSSDGVRSGIKHGIIYAANRVYELTASQCQLALSMTGYSSDLFTDSDVASWVIGGIPFCSEYSDLPLCAEQNPDAEEVTEAWWASGSGVSLPSGGEASISLENGFRNHWRNRWAWDGCFNGKKVWQQGPDDATSLRLATLAPADASYGYGTSLQQVRWFDGTGLYYEPLLIWSDRAGGRGRLMGQMWDAVRCSIDRPLEDQIQTEEVDPDAPAKYASLTWRNFAHYQGSMATGNKGTYWGSLYLLRYVEPHGDLESNYVY